MNNRHARLMEQAGDQIRKTASNFSLADFSKFESLFTFKARASWRNKLQQRRISGQSDIC